MLSKDEIKGLWTWKRDLKAELEVGAKVVDTTKGPVEYVILGESGPVVATIHGGPGGYDQGVLYWGDLVSHGFRVLAWSRPGYLRTPLANGRTIGEQADVLMALMDALGIEKAALAGVSAGGATTYATAINHPGRIWALIPEAAVCLHYELLKGSQKVFSKLMFNNPAMWLYDISAHLAPKSTAKSFIKLESTLAEEQVEELMEHVFQDPRRSELMLGFIKTMAPVDLRWEGIQNDLAQLAAIDKLPLEKISVPTLLIHGTNDADVPPAHAEYALANIPGAEIMWVENGFHILPLADNYDEQVARKVDFLKAHAPA